MLSKLPDDHRNVVSLLSAGIRLDIRERTPEIIELEEVEPPVLGLRHHDDRLTMLLAATFKNVASPYCSDERGMNL